MCILVDTLKYCIVNKSTKRMQTSAKVAHYPHIARIPNLASQHCDPDHPQNLFKLFLVSLQSYPEHFIKTTDLCNGRISNWIASMVIRVTI